MTYLFGSIFAVLFFFIFYFLIGLVLTLIMDKYNFYWDWAFDALYYLIYVPLKYLTYVPIKYAITLPKKIKARKIEQGKPSYILSQMIAAKIIENYQHVKSTVAYVEFEFKDIRVFISNSNYKVTVKDDCLSLTESERTVIGNAINKALELGKEFKKSENEFLRQQKSLDMIERMI